MKEFKPEWVNCIADLLNIAISHARCTGEFVTSDEVYHTLISSGVVVTETDDLTTEDMMNYIKNNICEGDEEQYNAFLKWVTDPLKQSLLKTIERIGNEPI